MKDGRKEWLKRMAYIDGTLIEELDNKNASLEEKLAKAVEIALEECPFRYGTSAYKDWWYDRRTTLAELKGEE